MLGGTDVMTQAEFATPLGRFRNATALYREIAQLTPSKTTAEWMEILSAAGFPAMPACDLGDVFADPHLSATDFFQVRDHPTEGRFREMRPPIRFSVDPDRVLGFAPGLDQHGDDIRTELNNILSSERNSGG
jgi:crotonobetainyl-CoA:carnitine CoA-transferase CaiB-like acyl-CoA transferase